MTTGEPDSEDESTEVAAETVNISTTQVGRVEAAQVRMSQSAAGEIKADEVDLRQSITARLSADQVSMHQTLSLLSQTSSLQAEQSSLVLTQAEEANLTTSSVGALFSRNQVTLNQSQVGVLVAQHVTGTPIKTTVLLARTVEGPIETTLDTPHAMLAGLTAGVSVGLVLLLGRLLTRRNR